MDRPLSQLIAPKLIFERRKEGSRRGKQRIVLLEGGEIQHRLSVQLVSGHAIPDALNGLGHGLPNRGTHLLELWPHCLGLCGNVLVDGRGNALFHIVILCFGSHAVFVVNDFLVGTSKSFRILQETFFCEDLGV